MVPCRKKVFTLLILLTIVYIVVIIPYPLYTYRSDVDDSWKRASNDGIVQKIFPGKGSTHVDSLRKGCSIIPQGLGKVKPNIDFRASLPDIDSIKRDNVEVGKGGEWAPVDCVANQRVAVIIPYRDRWEHLLHLLKHLHPLLQRQQCHYQIFVSEQITEGAFNKGCVMNSAFVAAMNIKQWDCIIFHDVDLIPESDLSLYRCSYNPVHLSAGVDVLRYTLMYKELVGGVLALTPKQFNLTNGFSNSFWGWGGEDDDMHKRIKKAGMSVLHASTHRGRYKMFPHVKGQASYDRGRLLADEDAWKSDGLRSLSSHGARVTSVTQLPLYTNITVDVGRAPQTVDHQTISWGKWLKNSVWLSLHGF